MGTIEGVVARLEGAGQLLAARGMSTLHDVADPHSNLYWIFILAFVAVGALVYVFAPPSAARRSLRGLLAYLFPRNVYLHPSARVDYLLYLLNRVLALKTLLFPGLVAWVEIGVMQWMSGHFGAPVPLLDVGSGWSLLAFTIVSAVVLDFALYATHALHHFVPVLWEIHKVHHSAEVLTPFTVYRSHPLYTVTLTLVQAGVVAPFLGVAAHFMLTDANVLTLFGVNGVFALFRLLSSNLRHSHIWVAYPRWLSHLLISPAQHQIHHSAALVHRNRNMGVVFAFWDWIFGTLYVPRGRETLTLGVAEGVAQEHPTLLDAWWVPLRNIGRMARRRAVRRNPAL